MIQDVAVDATRGQPLPTSVLPSEFIATARGQRWPLAQMIAMVEHGYRGDETLQKLARQAVAPETPTEQAAALWSQITAAMMKRGAIRTTMQVGRGSWLLHAVTRFVVRTFVLVVEFLALGYLVFTGLTRLTPQHPPVWPNVPNVSDFMLAWFGDLVQAGASLMATGLRVFGIPVNSPWSAGVVLVIGWVALPVFSGFVDLVESRPVRILDRHWTTIVAAVGRHKSGQWRAARAETPAQPEIRPVDDAEPGSEPDAAERIAVVRAALEQLGREWAEYELDLNAYCWTKPVLRNAEDPYTAAYTRAYSDLVHAADQLGGPATEQRLIVAAEAAAEKALAAWSEADAHALVVGNKDLDLIERTALRRLLTQVNLLADEATPQENWSQLRAAIDKEIAKITTVPVRRQALVRYLELEAPGRLRAIEAANPAERETA